jgi:RimJ/RimL family protein N-acetyltransferase/diadenosine tetraphosphate (Ap4A) HIT family hydrolase
MGDGNCITCSLNEVSTAPGGPIVDTSLWRLEHVIEPVPMAGWLVLKPFRHVEAFADLEPREAAELGPLLCAITRGMTEVLSPAKIYLSMFMEGEGFTHLHIHIIPRAADVPPDRRGPHVFEYLRETKSREPDAERTARAVSIATELRRRLIGFDVTRERSLVVHEWNPPSPPKLQTIAGKTVRLEPVNVGRDRGPLFHASHGGGDPHLWDYLFYGPFTNEDEFAAYLTRCATSSNELFFTIVDQETGTPSGIASYLRIVPKDGAIEIGHIWFAPSIQRSRQATEAIYLLARHVFDDLGYRRLEWKCDSRNSRSCRAAERFGFTFEGIFRQHMVVKGRSRDTAWFAMIDGEWPVIRAAYEKWLDDANFDEGGRQIRSLETIRAGLSNRATPLSR